MNHNSDREFGGFIKTTELWLQMQSKELNVNKSTHLNNLSHELPVYDRQTEIIR
jgi:hypothetical protein